MNCYNPVTEAAAPLKRGVGFAILLPIRARRFHPG